MDPVDASLGLMVEIAAKAALPLLVQARKSLARRGHGHQNLEQAFASTYGPHASQFRPLASLPPLPAPLTPSDVERVVKSSTFRALAQRRIAMELVDTEQTRKERLLASFAAYCRQEFGYEDAEAIDSYAKDVANRFDEACVRASAAVAKAIGDPQKYEDAISNTLMVDLLASIDSYLRLISTQGYISDSDVTAWIGRYAAAYGKQHSMIELPRLEDRKRIPYRELYVAPLLRKALGDGRQGGLGTLDDAFAENRRIVILGDPGAGKSTSTGVAALEALTSGRCRVAFYLKLKNCVFDSNGLNVIQALTSRLEKAYQCAPPHPTMLDKLLQEGNTMVVFDGLDEVLHSIDRRKAATAVEMFAHLYPLTQVAVTSRRIGYSVARLEDEFTEFTIQPFTNDQVARYVENWFAVSTGNDQVAVANVAAEFMATSGSMHDLRSNPLMLALICIMYHGRRYIPRTRPQLYSACALLLLNEWDKLQDLTEEVTNLGETQLALTEVAYVLMTDPKYAAGMPAEVIKEYFSQHLMMSMAVTRAEGEQMATHVLDLCRGRGWMFTAVGRNDELEELYAFTHQSFNEYFAAWYLTRMATSPEQLAVALSKPLSGGRWEVLAQICVSLMHRNVADGGSRVLAALARQARETPPPGGVALLSFLVSAGQAVSYSDPALRELLQAAVVGLAVWRDWTITALLEEDFPQNQAAAALLPAVLGSTLLEQPDHLVEVSWVATNLNQCIGTRCRSGGIAASNVNRVVRESACLEVGITSLRDWRALEGPRLLALQRGDASISDMGSSPDECFRNVFVAGRGHPAATIGPASIAAWLLGTVAQQPRDRVWWKPCVNSLAQLAEMLDGQPPQDLPYVAKFGLNDSYSPETLATWLSFAGRVAGHPAAVRSGYLYVALGLFELCAVHLSNHFPKVGPLADVIAGRRQHLPWTPPKPLGLTDTCSAWVEAWGSGRLDIWQPPSVEAS